MSSRRKSRPVRRLDTAGVEGIPLEISSEPVFEDPTYQDSLPTPEDSPQDPNLLNTETRLSNSDEDSRVPSDSPEESFENGRKYEGFPEGVYIVQPQGVSDDESEEVKSSRERGPVCEEDDDDEKTDFSSKKRQLDEYKEDWKKDGLDLSVKRRKMEDEIDGPNIHGREETSKPVLNSQDYQSNMQRFENFVQLLASKRRPITEDVRDNAQKGGYSQLNYDRQVSMAESAQSRDEMKPTDLSTEERMAADVSSWDHPTERDDGEKWDEKDNYSTTNSTSPVLHPGYQSSFTPAVAAAMMAKLVSNTDANVTESTASSAVLQNLFKQSQTLLSQQMTSSSKTPVGGQYSTSPDAMDTITAGTVSSGVGSIKKGTLDPTNFDEEVFDKYISRFNAKNSCMQASCPHINRDHFHCTDSDCNFQRFTNKSDVIRHYNMHKKRDNSLAHGFMRFAPTDNCQNQFGSCHLNGKSTHYHCLHSNCTRVYTSTSDVMTHENFHKKNQHFVTNGFQRYRATEVCDADFCPFRHQRTTHFHCTRQDCNFTFKNKCDIEKHKSYHMRDDAYTRQGFKKFYKNEPCHFLSCAWNRTANHFHCLRKNCEFSFTSTGQMVSHKRKHDRQDMLTMDRTSTTSSVSTTSSKPLSSEKSSVSKLSVFTRPLVPPHYARASYPHQRSFHLNARSPTSSVLHSFSFLHPYLRSSFLKRPSTSMGLEPGSSGSPTFDSMAYQEAARKVLASSVAASATALPRTLGSFSKPESSNLLNFKTTSTSPNLMFGSLENSFNKRDESEPEMTSERDDSYLDRPPPPYTNGPLNMSSREAAASEQDNRCQSNNDDSENDDWPSTGQRNSTVASPEIINEEENEILNLSRKSLKAEDTEEKSNVAVDKEDPQPSPLVLKYFRGLPPNECAVSHCYFKDRYHFHCLVQDCYAAFTDKCLVFNHTLFHDNLEKLGVSQSTAKNFPAFYPLVSRSASSHDPPTPPPPGYITLGTNSHKPKEVYREPEKEFRDVVFTSSDQVAKENDELRQVMRNPSPQEAKESERQTPSSTSSAVYEYISRIISENNSKPLAGYLHAQQSYPPSTRRQSPYLSLQNPSEIASLVRSQSCTLPESKEQRESFKNANSSPADCYIHVRAGSACIRPDCKYVLQSHWHCTLNRCRYVCKSLAKAQSHRQAHDSLEAYARAAKEYFKSYTVKKNCPNPNCEFRLRGHYHCLKPGCQFVTIGTSKLPWHMKKHEKIAKREASGFKYYTKKDQCGKPDCKYNGMFSHYHCIRAGCSFAFQYKHQMSTHVRKHLRRMLGRSYSGADVAADIGNVDHSNVDSGDDSLPLIVDEADEIEQRPGVSMETNQPMHFQGLHHNAGLTRPQMAMLEQMSRGFKPLLSVSSEPLDHNNNVQSNSMDDEQDMSNDVSNDEIDENSSNEEILDLRANSNVQDTDSNSNSSSFTGYNNESFVAADVMKSQDPDNIHLVEQERNLAARFPVPDRQDDSGTLFSKFRLNNDVMNGFKRFEISENCGDPQCSYALRVSHYHCLHEDCQYRFTGRTHMFKHRQHHERVAGLVRDDFKRFRANQPCQSDDCIFNGQSTHFHCLRCQFKCTDSAKVGAHRRHHVKADTLEQSGFERFKGKEDCGKESCKYRNRNTSHFHCLQVGCSYAVVGLSGIEQHAKKHKKIQTQHQSDQVNFSIITKPLINSAESSIITSPFADSSLLGSSNLVTYSVPFTALSSASNVIARSNNGSSPVSDEQPSVSPVVTSQLRAGQIRENTDVGFINLGNLALKREIPGAAMSAGLKM